jgi:YacP-like NYN domain-containing protein
MRDAETAQRDAVGRVERARSQAEEAEAGRAQLSDRLARTQAELREARASTRVSAATEAAHDAQRAAEEALEAAVRDRDRALVAEREAERRLDAAQVENTELRRQVGRPESERSGESERLLDEVTRALEALDKLASSLRSALGSSGRSQASEGPSATPAPGRSPERPRVPAEGRRAAPRDRVPESPTGVGAGRPLPGLPPGMNPDSPEGLRAMLRSGVLVIVDGYNVLLDREGMVSRSALLSAMAGLVTGTSAQVRIYFDGIEPGRRREGQVEIVFTSSDREADDAILGDVARVGAGAPVVVVSNDRRVSEGARDLGAEAVSSRSLLRALRLRRG